MEWPFARCDQIGRVQTIGVRAEIKAPIVQTDAIGGLNHARAKAQIVALDEADHHAVFIGCGQVNGAALDRIARLEILRFVHVNEFGAALQILCV